ncbi:hypothetical protein PRIPAC_93322 [Pristionchus pacificus]|nr:hypothetical protein PRIPAC_93322 [Pristionchus pacificus]
MFNNPPPARSPSLIKSPNNFLLPPPLPGSPDPVKQSYDPKGSDPLSGLSASHWYHGLLPRDDIKTFLVENGDYLVRMSEPVEPGKREYILSTMFDKSIGKIKHFVIVHSGERFILHSKSFRSIPELVKYFASTKKSLTGQMEVVIRRAIARSEWQLEHEEVQSTKKLGEGAFGEVHKGILKLRRCNKKIDVAIKLAKLDAMTKDQIQGFMKEARLMRDFDHPNVVRLYGVAATQEPLMLVMELASDGALDSYLKKHACTVQTKLTMILQAAWGIEYLHERPIIHRDLASRNCLYGDGKVKISDFGLSREGRAYVMHKKCRLPVRWLAPETLRQLQYSTKTDVWSYGIMCWEILNDGKEPYPGMTVAEVNVKVREGYRMPIDFLPGLDGDVINLISHRCWSEDKESRPEITVVARELERVTHTPRPESRDAIFGRSPKVAKTQQITVKMPHMPMPPSSE